MTGGLELAGRYRPEKLIGRGGMANVYLGTDTRLARRIAIKALRPEIAIDKESRRRFQREARAVSMMGHPSIVRVYDAGEETISAISNETPIPFIVMEYIDGKILRKLMDAGPFDPKVAVHIALGILDALDESHRAGIVHRDIKPGNVMITPSGLVKVCDFGIAQAVEDPTNDPSAVVGTAQYFSPEQAKGEIIDGRSDLYSTAVVLFEMLTGTPLFTGETSVSVAFQHVSQTAPRVRSRRPEISPDLDVIVAKALEKDRAARYPSAADFARALRGVTRYTSTVPAATSQTPAPSAPRIPSGKIENAKPVQSKGPVDLKKNDVFSTLKLNEIRDQLKEDAPPPVNSRQSLLMIAGGIAIVSSVIAGLMYWTLTFSDGSGVSSLAVEVPELGLKQFTDAETMLTDLGLGVEKVSEVSDTVPAGVVIRTSPEGGVRVSPKEVITVYVSRGPESAGVPELSMANLEDATKLIENAGFKVGTVTAVYSATAPKNTVLSMVPAAGTELPTGSTIDLTVSNGKVQVPDVRGMTIQKAKGLLEAPTVQYLVEIITDTSCTGAVVSNQSILPGDGPQYQTIQLTYCAG